MSKKIICNVITGQIQELPLSAEELIELQERQANTQITSPAPTKEELMAELAVLTAKINALE